VAGGGPPSAGAKAPAGAGPVGAYPGSFNPPTVAHLAIAQAALDQAGLRRVDLIVSESALGKEDVDVPTMADRMSVLEDVASSRPWLGVRLTRHRLLADIAEGYDALIVGADKWAQLLDVAWYGGSEAERDRNLARLRRVLVFERPPYPTPGTEWPSALAVAPVLIRVGAELAAVSSTGARAGRRAWMLEEAAAWDDLHGGWSDPLAYSAELKETGSNS
jgi:nicotinic acid mononucleotide adenylyltransferase